MIKNKKAKATIGVWLLLVGIIFVFILIQNNKTQVTIPSSFMLEENQVAQITNYQNMKVKLLSVSICPPNAQCLVADSAKIEINTPGGCGPNADPRCLGPPASRNEYNLFEGNSVNIMGINLKLIKLIDKKASFMIAFIQ